MFGLEWIKTHLLVSMALATLLLYVAFQWAATWLVLCRDAYLTADVVIVAREVSGPMLALFVHDNEPIQRGALLFSVDPKPFQIELNRQRAALEAAKADDISPEALDNLQRVYQVALARAEFELSRTAVRSPASGRVAPFQIRPGSYLETGKPVMALLTDENWRVVANLDERRGSRPDLNLPDQTARPPINPSTPDAIGHVVPFNQQRERFPEQQVGWKIHLLIRHKSQAGKV